MFQNVKLPEVGGWSTGLDSAGVRQAPGYGGRKQSWLLVNRAIPGVASARYETLTRVDEFSMDCRRELHRVTAVAGPASDQL